MDKGDFHLLNPTPREFMREMSTDRPDKTESPYTVDAGHVQLEMDFFNFTRHHDPLAGSDTLTTTWSIAPVNFKLGLMNSADAQLVFDNYIRERVNDRVAGIRDTTSGFGDVTARLKINLWGNDGGATACALMPQVKCPAASSSLGNGKVEGGIILPFAVKLPLNWSMGLMTEFDFVRNAANSGYDTEFVNSITFGHDLTQKLGVYVEFFSLTSTAPASRWAGTVDMGLTYALTDNLQLDGGVNLGVTRAADEVQPFVGISWRY